MDCFKCPICNRKSIDPINLRCDHHPCFQCASQIIKIDEQSTLETRYLLLCPLCHKKTITYDLRHLIINATQQDQDLFVTTKFINKKPEVMAKKCNNYVESDKSTRQSKRNSMHGIMVASNRPINLDCKKHPGSQLQYYCDDCNIKNQQTFMCSECVKFHQKHKIFNIRNVEDKIEASNQKKRKELIPTRKKIIEDSIYFLSNRKQSIQLEYQNLLNEIEGQFKLIHAHLDQQQQQLKKEIKSYYLKQNQQLHQSISFGQKIHQSLKNLQKISNYSRTQIETEVNFSICISDLEMAFQTGKPKLNDKYDLPIVVRKNGTMMSNEKLFQLQVQRCKQQGSKVATPSNNNSKQNNFNLDSKCFRNNPDKQSLNTSLLKQNFYPASPKNHFPLRLNA